MKTTNWVAKIITAVIVIGTVFALLPTSTVRAEATSTTSNTPSIQEFSSALRKSDSSLLTGLYVNGVMAVPVLQQPPSNPAYVSTRAETVTQFSLANEFGSVGILAHNYLAGSYFSKLQSGAIITLVYGDGSTKYYQVSSVKAYRALSPNNAYSNFVNLDNPDVTLSSTDLFYQTYGLGNVLVLQTCIYENGDPSWGRLFVIATPYEGTPVVTYQYYRNLESVHEF